MRSSLWIVVKLLRLLLLPLLVFLRILFVVFPVWPVVVVVIITAATSTLIASSGELAPSSTPEIVGPSEATVIAPEFPVVLVGLRIFFVPVIRRRVRSGPRPGALKTHTKETKQIIREKTLSRMGALKLFMIKQFYVKCNPTFYCKSIKFILMSDLLLYHVMKSLSAGGSGLYLSRHNGDEDTFSNWTNMIAWCFYMGGNPFWPRLKTFDDHVGQHSSTTVMQNMTGNLQEGLQGLVESLPRLFCFFKAAPKFAVSLHIKCKWGFPKLIEELW